MNRGAMLNSLEVEATDKISDLLRDTVLLLCRNGFNFQLNIKVQGLVAITLDEKEVFLVKFDESGCKVPMSDPMENKHNEASRQVVPDQQLSRRCGRGKRNRLRGNLAGMDPATRFEQSQNLCMMGGGAGVDGIPNDSLHDNSALHNPFQASLGGNQENEEQDSSSTVSVKEESDQDQFNQMNFQENDVNMRNQFPIYGHGMMMPGEGDHPDDPLWSMPLRAVSGRGRRARRSGQKMYSCEHPGCGLSFYRSYTLYRHQRLKHGQRLVPSANQQNRQMSEFRCPIDGCGQVFMRASVLEKHVREVHQNNGTDETRLPAHEGFMGKTELDRYDENELLFGAMEYGLLSR